MPTYEFECPKHGPFELTLRLAEWDDHKPCSKCGKDSEQVVRLRERQSTIRPIVVHLSAKGKYRFPANENAPVPRGFERIELKTLPEIRAFENRVNRQLESDAQLHNQNEEIAFKQVKDRNRAELLHRMRSMSPVGRAFAQFCIARNNARRRKSSHVGFHVEILNYDQSNREAQSDASTGWKRKYF